MAELNLIPYELKQRKQDKLKSKDIIAYVILFVCLTFSAIYFPLMNLNSLSKNQATLKAEVDKNQSEAQKNSKLNQEIMNVKKHTEIVELLTKQRVMTNTAIKGIEVYIPADVVITSLSYEKNVINISAKSASYNSICIFAANLQTSKDYGAAKLVSINSDQASSFTGAIMITKQEVK